MTMTELTRWQQYQICKEEGHQPHPIVMDFGNGIYTCERCGVEYCFEPELTEYNVPQEPTDDK